MKFKETKPHLAGKGKERGGRQSGAACAESEPVPSVIWSGQADHRQRVGAGRRHREENL